jgi:hypothetical protein
MCCLAMLSPSPSQALDKTGTMKRWGPFQITLSSASMSDSSAHVELLLQNAGTEDHVFSFGESVRVLSIAGDMGAIQSSSSCSAVLPPAGKLKCKLDVIFDADASALTVQFVDDAMVAMVSGRERWPLVSFSVDASRM